MYYLDFWLPHIAEGTNLRVGRYISIPDIEAQLAPNNITYSHSLLYTYDPYTQNGVVATTKLDKNWTDPERVVRRQRRGPWDKSERHLTPALCVIWTSDSGKDNVYPCMNGLNDGNWRWNNIQHAVITWYHKINAKWHTDTEVWYMWESHTPNVDNDTGPDGSDLGTADHRAGLLLSELRRAIGCDLQIRTLVYCYSYEWAALNYLNYQIGPRDIVTLRTDYLNDARGQRTGFKTRYYEFEAGYTHWLGDAIELRPELRFEHARDADAYDNPTATLGMGRNSQFMFAADAIFHF